MTNGQGLSATSLEIPDPIRRGKMAVIWVIQDAAGSEVDRFPGFAAVTTSDQAIERHRKRVAEREAQRAAQAGQRSVERAAALPGTAVASTAPEVAPAASQGASPAPRPVARVRPALLYHFTTAAGLRGILGDDAIRALSQHVLNGRTVSGVSLTRDRWFDFEAHKVFRLSLDPERLPGRTVPVRDAYMQNQHKAHPVDDEFTSTPTNEAEEFHIGPVRDLGRCLVEIAVMEDLLDSPKALRGALGALAEADLPHGARLLAVDRRQAFGARERPLDPDAYDGPVRPDQLDFDPGPITVPSWPRLLRRVLDDARMANSELHGDGHWRAVAAAGRMLTDLTPGADRTAVQVFALVHDTMRRNDDDDPEHGQRGGAYLRALSRDGLIGGSKAAVERLVFAIQRHNGGELSPDATVGCCWDADRLNLWRVDVQPDPDLLSTDAARRPDVLDWSMSLHATAPAWRDVLADGFDPWIVGGYDTDFERDHGVEATGSATAADVRCQSHQIEAYDSAIRPTDMC